MGRKPRDDIPGAIFHLWARGNNRGAIFRGDEDRLDYLRILARASRLSSWRCLGFCQMTNHVHLLIETPQGGLSSGVQMAHGAYARRFNARHGHVGHVFQSRFGAERIKSDRQLVTVVNYIARNPVNAGLCALPGDWPWSSFGIRDVVPSWVDVVRLEELTGCRRQARS